VSATADPLTAHRVDLRAPGALAELTSSLARHGIAVFTGVSGQAALLGLARRLGQVVGHRDADPSGVTTITPRPTPATAGAAGFTTRGLRPHTDGSDQAEPPHLMMLACAQPAPRGGDCVVVDGQAVHAELATIEQDALAELSAPRSVLFGGAGGHLGAVFETLPGKRVRIRLRTDERARFNPHVQRRLPLLHHLVDEHALVFTLPAGAGYVVNNHRWLHARTAFTGPRMMRRVLITPHRRLALPAGFAPESVAS
jgi:alpha-ketoglutarate-dependent taurine dioxygenase